MWHDPAATREEILARLRLSAADIDVTTIEAIIPAAAETIDQYLDRFVDDPVVGPPPPPALQEALVVASIAQYHHAAVVATLGGGVVSGLTAVAEPFDPLADVYVLLAPFRQGWAVA